ncbi:hypothetical protein [Chryseobacterium indoltheticum]|uniref:hypothetical protein n=1 Tax=Chryseobacterium indoltheticum TaxID=254 RepID=UPI004041F0E6
MKAKILITLFCIILIQFFHAQIDDKFYQPSKELKPIENLKYEEISYPVDKDTITAIVLKPNSSKPKATILFFPRSSRKCFYLYFYDKTFGRKWISSNHG